MHYQENNLFKEFISKAQSHKANKLPFVLYQLPNQKLVKGVFQDNANLNYTSTFVESGFVFSPFKSDNAILLYSDHIDEVPYKSKTIIYNKSTIDFKEDSSTYMNLVNKAISKIENGVLEKVVVSRKIETTTTKDEFQLFEALLDNYINAFKYLWYHPKIGMWLGATPEILLKTKGNCFTTISLAGTIPVKEKPPEWTKKEINEQQLVTDYIVTNLKTNVDSITAKPAVKIKAGKLWHLKSLITGKFKNDTNLGQILKILHPTPAICLSLIHI